MNPNFVPLSAENLLDRGMGRGPAEHVQELDVSAKEFCVLRGITLDEVLGRKPVGPMYDLFAEDISDLRAIIQITLEEMARLNSSSMVIPLDDPQRMLDLVTQDFTKIALLHTHGTHEDPRKVVGFARIFEEKTRFPDRDEIPVDLLEGSVCRFDRFFITEEGRVLDSRGGAASRLLDKIIEIADGRTVIMKVLVGPPTIGPEWLIAKRALEQRGCEDTGRTDLEFFSHPQQDGKVPAEFRWYLHPLRTAKGKDYFKAIQGRLRELVRPVEIRLAHTVAHVSSDGGLIVCYSRQPDAWNLAKVYQKHAVIGVRSAHAAPWRNEKRPNLYISEQDLLMPAAPQKTVGTVTVFGALNDIVQRTQRTVDENFIDFFKIQKDQLIAGGTLVLLEELANNSPRSLPFSLKQVTRSIELAGFRVLMSVSTEGKESTQFKVVAESIGPDDPIEIRRVGPARQLTESKFLRLQSCERVVEAALRTVGERRSIVCRPNVTLDLIPYKIDETGGFSVLTRINFPRPLVLEAGPLLDGSTRAPFLMEQLSIIVDKSVLESEQKILSTGLVALQTRSALTSDQIEAVDSPTWYLPSADITDEKTVVLRFRVNSDFTDGQHSNGISGFSTDGSFKFISGSDLLRACQKGGRSDSRTERVVYGIFLDHKQTPDFCILPDLKLSDQKLPAEITSASEVLKAEGVNNFRAHEVDRETFFTVSESSYQEIFSDNSIGPVITREVARPGAKTGYSNNVIAVLPVIKCGDKIFAGILRSPDMPGAALNDLGSFLATAPQFLIKSSVFSDGNPEDWQERALAEVSAKMEKIFGLRAIQLWAAGEPFFSSIGATARVTFPYVIEVEEITQRKVSAMFSEISDLLEQRNQIRCGVLQTLLYRTAHALELL